MNDNVQIGPYKMLSKLGYGGMAVVYHAIDTRDQQDVALKILLPQYYNDDAFLRRFSKESLNARRLNHPNIVKTLAAGHDDGFHYIAMQFIDGSTLEQYISGRGQLSLIETVRVLAPIASGLDYAHDLGYVHRDLKLNNVMRSKEGRCYLTDFGVSKHLSTDLSMMTGIGQSIGTPSYMSPEQARGDRISDGKSDIYSFGVIAYRLMTGQLPFTASDPFELTHKIIFMDPLDPRQLNPYIDKEAALALRRALAKDPADRPDSCQGFIDSLSGLGAQKPAEKTSIFSSKLFSGGRNFQPAAWLPGARSARQPATARPRPAPAARPVHRAMPQHDPIEPGAAPMPAAQARQTVHTQPSEVTQPGMMAKFPRDVDPQGNSSLPASAMTDLVTIPVDMQIGHDTQPVQMKPTRPQPYLPTPANATPNTASSAQSEPVTAPFVPGEPLPGQPPRPKRKRKTTVLTRGIKPRPQTTPAAHDGTLPRYEHRRPDQETILPENDWFGPGMAKESEGPALADKLDEVVTILYRWLEPLMRRFRGGFNLDVLEETDRETQQT